MKRVFRTLLICILSVVAFCIQAQEKEQLVLIDTNMGKIKVKLFNDTPLHRDNFIKNVQEKRYDGTLFHRVVKHFMIQGGDFSSVGATAETALGKDSLDYSVPAEIIYPKYFHKKGMLCAARPSDDENPEKVSSPAQFYISTGKFYTAMELDKMEAEKEIKFTPEQRDAYMREGGVPHLDGEYTIFGEVVSGIKIVDKIQYVEKTTADRPVKDIIVKSMTLVDK
ncbi:peptidylprolyl isomerase [Parabacteroides sp. OttesenSCG-928-G07]|nr:peptidylprolyl isomerase [Parabacteroides sp. OttesenSCG-928-G07]